MRYGQILVLLIQLIVILVGIVRWISRLSAPLTGLGSDVHFEPYEKKFRVRTRLDGVLSEVASPPVILATKVCARLKVMSRMDIAERRVPQDGRIKMRLSKNRAIDFYSLQEPLAQCKGVHVKTEISAQIKRPPNGLG